MRRPSRKKTLSVQPLDVWSTKTAGRGPSRISVFAPSPAGGWFGCSTGKRGLAVFALLCLSLLPRHSRQGHGFCSTCGPHRGTDRERKQWLCNQYLSRESPVSVWLAYLSLLHTLFTYKKAVKPQVFYSLNRMIRRNDSLNRILIFRSKPQ